MPPCDQWFVRSEYQILDCRKPDEYASGHIPGALNTPSEEFLASPTSVFYAHAFVPTLILHCNRSTVGSGRGPRCAAAYEKAKRGIHAYCCLKNKQTLCNSNSNDNEKHDTITNPRIEQVRFVAKGEGGAGTLGYGSQKVYVLSGGMAKWKEEGKPVDISSQL